MFSFRSIPLGLVLLLAAATPAWAVIEKLTKLADLVRDAETIAVLKVTRITERGIVFEADQEIVGKLVPPRMPVALEGAAEEERAALTKRLAVGATVVFFGTPNGDEHLGLFYTEGSWFRLKGIVDGPTVRWQFTNAEPYLPRTFHDSTGELARTLAAHKFKGKKLPEPDSHLKPGLGPEWSAVVPSDPAEPLIPAELLMSDPVVEPPAAAPQPALAPAPVAPPPEGPSRWLLAGIVVVVTMLALALNVRWP